MPLKRKVLIAVGGTLVYLVALQLFAGLFYAVSPIGWSLVRAGMSGEQVFATIGTPIADTADLKGQDCWRRAALFNERTLVVRYDTSRAVESVGESNYWRWSSE